jgi:hypothetical protein
MINYSSASLNVSWGASKVSSNTSTNGRTVRVYCHHRSKQPNSQERCHKTLVLILIRFGLGQLHVYFFIVLAMMILNKQKNAVPRATK